MTPAHPSPPSRLEWIAVVHVGLMVVFATWAFGGSINWARDLLTLFGGFGLVVTIAAVRERLTSHDSVRALHILWPLLGLNLLVLLSLFQPNLRVVTIEGGAVFVPRTELTSWPSSARPELAWRDLLLFNALFLPGFNLLLAVRHRRTLRTLFLLLAANALALAIFGSLQQLSGANGLYFGSVASPNPQFFASFVYRNHWGAFAILMLAVCIGLIFHERPWAAHRDFWHSPAFAAVVATLLLGATIPLSAARACSAFAVVLITSGVLHALRRVIRHQRARGGAASVPVSALCLALALGGFGIYSLARESIHTRMDDTQTQFARMRAQGNIGNRAQLYGDTWHMARDRLWFGWGLGSYGTVFVLYNRATSPADGLPVYYENAHSDWLQWLAEIGVAGTTLLFLLMAAPFFITGFHWPFSALPQYVLTGCGLVLFYAVFEFPLANPAVMLCFWTCLMCAVRWSRLENTEPTS